MKMPWIIAILILAFGIGVSFFACSSSGGGDDDSGGNGDDGTTDDDIADDDDADDDVDDTNVDDDTNIDDDTDVDDDTNIDDDTADIWTDSSSGLTWQVTPSSAYLTWDGAKTHCDSLALAGVGWRLPTISEFRGLIRGCDATVTGGACGVKDDCLDASCWNDPCNGCEILAGPGSGGAYWPEEMAGEIDWYWSSSPTADVDSHAWRVNFSYGRILNFVDSSHNLARCVRP